MKMNEESHDDNSQFESTKEATINFIEDYKNHEVLWNTDIKDYSNKQLRTEALQQLSTKYRIDVISVKNKIKNLRSYFCKEYERTLKKRGGYTSNWFAYKYMTFLKDVSKPLSFLKTESIQHYPEQVTTTKTKTTHAEVDGDIEERVNTLPASTSHVEMPTVFSKTKKRQQSDNMEEEHSQLLQFLKQNIKPSDEYSSFGEYVSHKIKKLCTERLRNIAQNRIINILFELEMSEENNRQCSSPHSTLTSLSVLTPEQQQSSTSSTPPIQPILQVKTEVLKTEDYEFQPDINI